MRLGPLSVQQPRVPSALQARNRGGLRVAEITVVQKEYPNYESGKATNKEKAEELQVSSATAAVLPPRCRAAAPPAPVPLLPSARPLPKRTPAEPSAGRAQGRGAVPVTLRVCQVDVHGPAEAERADRPRPAARARAAAQAQAFGAAATLHHAIQIAVAGQTTGERIEMS